MTRLFFIFLILWLLLPFAGHAQDLRPFRTEEESLVRLSYKVLYAKDGFVRLSSSSELEESLSIFLLSGDSYEYPFDSLKSVSILSSPDGSFRIFTWGIPGPEGVYDYAGLIQMRPENGGPCRVIRLKDMSREMYLPGQQSCKAENWFGALYYKLLHNSYDGEDFYTLLGWRSPGPYSRMKLIEILKFDKKGEAVFGAPLFSRFPGNARRVIFEYSSQAMMSLNFSEQSVKFQTVKRKKRKTLNMSADLIVFDRLAPMEPQLEGQYQFYVPETNIQDGFLFHKGKWHYLKEVDARNPEQAKERLKTEPPEQGLFPEKINK